MNALQRWARKNPRALEWAYHYASFFPGIVLSLAFVGALIGRQLSPITELPISNIEALTSLTEIGKIPIARMNWEPPQGMKGVFRNVPVFDAAGRPQLNEVQRVIRGRGHAFHLGDEIREVLIPHLGNPTFFERQQIAPRAFPHYLDGRFIPPQRPGTRHRLELERETSSRALFYEPNVVFDRTGVFERFQKVEFRSAIDPNLYALWGGVIGTVIGISIFHLRESVTDSDEE